jgi:glutamate:GABA antiporter
MSESKPLGIFALTMITITSVDSIRNLPATSLFGSPLIFFFIIAGLFFLLPSALVSAELASACPKAGGIYAWVKEAMGERYGFLAIWFQWIENVIWYPTILSFIAGTCAYLISPELAHNKYFLITVIVSCFWLLTFVNLAGIKTSARFSEFCGIAGLLVPMLLIIGLGSFWILSGHPIEIAFEFDKMLPSFHEPSLFVSITAVVLCFCGMEIATAHTQDVKNPTRDYPIALMLSVAIIFFTMLLGSLAIAIVVPQTELSLVAGIMQAFVAFFQAYHWSWMTPIVALFIILGSLGGVSNWIIAPSRGLCVALQDAGVAKFLQPQNKHGTPVRLLIWQAIFVTLLSMVFLFMPSINSSYWILTALTAQLYMIMYVFIFLSVLRLRHKQPNIPRPFKVPGGMIGIYVVAGSGLIASLLTIIIGFFPPDAINIGSLALYQLFLLFGLLIASSPPFIWYTLRNSPPPKVAITDLEYETLRGN